MEDSNVNSSQAILIVIPNLGRGGAQVVFRNQLEILKEEFVAHGCVFNYDGSFPEDREVVPFSLEVPSGKNVIGKITCFLTRVRRLRKLKHDKRIGISISHLEGADYINVLSGRSRTILWIHGSKRFDKNISGIVGVIRHRILMPFLYRRADHIVAVSKGIAEEIKGYIGDSKVPISVIYNGFDIDQIKRNGEQPVPDDFKNLAANHKLIVTHCRLSRQKNLEALLAIFRKVFDHGECKLVIIGDGELRDSLLTLSKQLELKTWSAWDGTKMPMDSNVFFLGQQANPLCYLKQASLFAMTSAWEGFPLALCEAVILGVPAITSDCPTGPREIMMNENELEADKYRVPLSSPLGTLMPMVEQSDGATVSIWADRIWKMLNHWNNDKSSDARNTVIDKLRMDKQREATMKVIRKLGENHSPK